MSSDTENLTPDYLVIGAGAMGMAFTDTIVTESAASVVIVDRRDKPGGHWNDAYPFVRLHSASAYYGVNSHPLGQDRIEPSGLNRGYHERASAAEICAYFDRIMRHHFLRSRRVQYFPLCEYRGNGEFYSLISGRRHRIAPKRVVDATFTDTSIPSLRTPDFAVAPAVRCIAPNGLLNAAPPARYVVVGAGKTGMDVCQWLLERDVAPERICWIVPRDSWLLDRAHFEPRDHFWKRRMDAFVTQMELIQSATSIPELFQSLTDRGQLLRIDERVTPTRYRCATVSQAELVQLRRIRDVVRLGHVRSIEPTRIVLDQGEVPTNLDTLHIDCTASGIRSQPAVPVFNDNTITLQSVRTCQQCFSAALIVHVDLTYRDDEMKNALCKPIPLPNVDRDWLKMLLANLANQFLWATTPEVRGWIARSRLDLNRRATPFSAEESAVLQRFRDAAAKVPAKAMALLQA